ncbi:FAD/NAD(P)-binding protein [Sphaerisporangium sp. NBC_01403]|uniref:FAD/NAD(P)-binding protein n=1 Tax=Sphaerisporangium sp. NBC_01403 TaxID=2903599 RepID=UPI00325044E3
MASSPVVAVVGGGASGTLAAIHLLHLARARGTPLRVTLIDRYGRHALGQAYSTTDPHHLLNACVDKMSALEDDRGHLLTWARESGLDVAASDFFPREAYGRYLRHVLDAATGPGHRVTRVTGTARAITRQGSLCVHLSDGRSVEADAAVLATGNPTGDPAGTAWPHLAGDDRYVPDPWAPAALAGIGEHGDVLVVGTGLTMVDIAVTVTRASPEAVVYAVSRHGLLPRPHRRPSPPCVETPIPDGPLRLAALLRAVRAAVRDNDGDWYGVVDGLRPRVPELWSRLPTGEQRRFLSLAARYWEVHRHRVPPATADRVAELRATGRLRVLRGRVTGAAPEHGGLAVQVDDGVTARELRVGRLVNGTGPAFGIARDPLVARLLGDGLVRLDPLGLGMDADAGGRVLNAAGRPDDRIVTLGPTLRGTRYETTAIPEIRAQAAALAPHLLKTVTSGDPPARWGPAPLRGGRGEVSGPC